MSRLLRNQLLVGDVREVLPTLPELSVDCVITSPPYFRLRNYQADGQIGLEASVDGWVDELRSVMRALARVLKPTGGVWINLGDTYSRHERDGASPKSLLLGPERLAMALIEDDWIIRNKVIWAKRNPMPASVTDRLSSSWEVFYFATRGPQYFFDLDAIRVPHLTERKPRVSEPRTEDSASTAPPEWAGPHASTNRGLDRNKAQGLSGHPLGKNPGDVWQSSTASYRGAHHAMFPEQLITRPLLASCPARVCVRCGQPWEHERVRQVGHLAVVGELRSRCRCAAPWRPGVVLDPFMGAGTVAVVAEDLQRDWVGIELNPDFARLTEDRLQRARNARELPTDAADAASRSNQ